MKSTKVIQINSECGRGSTGKITVSISKLLDSNGIENYVFYSGNHKSNYANGRRIAGKLSIRIHQVLSRIFGDQGFHSSWSTMRLIRRIRKIDPDVILLHNLHGYYLNLRMLFRFLKQYAKPVYWTLHDCWAFTGHCTHFTAEKCNKWQTGCYSCVKKKQYPYSWFWDRSKQLYARKKQLFTSLPNLTLITPSEWLAQLVKQSFLGRYPVCVINNGIDLNVFKPTPSNFRQTYGIGNKKIILGVASVWSYYKGLDVFVSLHARLDRERYQIVLVGTDRNVDQQLPEGIISIHRTQNQKELAEIYSAADVFVNPTREENYPTVNMEAIACGTQVVTFNTGGCAEMLNQDCGIVVSDNSVDELEKMIIVASSKQIDTECYLQHAQQFNERKCFEKYVRLISN